MSAPRGARAADPLDEAARYQQPTDLSEDGGETPTALDAEKPPASATTGDRAASGSD